MKKTTIIALLLCVVFTSCDWYCYNPDIEFYSIITLYKYNTGEQYIHNVKAYSIEVPDGIVAEVIPEFYFIYHNKGFIEYGSQGDTPDTANLFLLSFTYDELDTMNDEWKKHFNDYIIPNTRISEMYTATICGCHKRPCFYENYPFCRRAKDGTYFLDQTTTNQMIDNGTLWGYFQRII